MPFPNPVQGSAAGASYNAPAGPPAPAPAPTNCSRVTIEIAANGGFTVQATPKPSPSKGGDSSPYPDSETHVFKSLEEVIPFLASCFGGDQAAPANDTETETAGAMPPPGQ